MLTSKKDKKRKLRDGFTHHFAAVIVDTAARSQYSDTDFVFTFFRNLAGGYRVQDKPSAEVSRKTAGDYSLLRAFLGQEEHKLHLIAITFRFNFEKVLSHFLISDMQLVFNDLLGYIVLVDCSYSDIPAKQGFIRSLVETSEGLTEWQEKQTTLPPETGWFGVEIARSEIAILKELEPEAPKIILAIHSKLPNAMPIQELPTALGLNENVKILSWDSGVPNAEHHVLLELIHEFEELAGKNDFADLSRKIVQANMK